MSNGADDVARSVRRYFAGMLNFPWSFALERDEIRDEQRPAGLIEAGEATASGVRIGIPSPSYTVTMPLTLVIYPSLPTGDGGPRLAGWTARRLADALERLITLGAEGIEFEDGRPASGPMRMPLWDWGDIPLFGDPEDRTGPEFPTAVIWVESASTNAIQDPQDARRWTVIAEMSLSWERGGRAAPDAPVVIGIPGTPRLT